MGLKPYPDYKDSGAIWLAAVPASWSISPLGHFFTERSQTVSDKEFQPLSVTMQGIVPQMENVAKTENGDNRKLVRRGDFVINSRSDRKGSSGVADRDGSVSVISIVLEPRSISPRFVHHLLRSTPFQEEFYRFGSGIVADLWSTRFSSMKSIRLAVPTLSEQNTIADYLDRETAEIDAFIADQEELIVLLNERRAATITQAVTKGLDSTVPMKESGVEWLGRMPSAWIVEPIKRVASIRGRIGFRGYTTADLVSADEGAVTLSPGNMREGRLRWENSTYISWEKYVESPEIIVEDQDILLVKTGSTFGKVSFVELPNSVSATINPQIVILRAETILKRFLYYAIDNSRVYSEFRSYPTGGTTPTMTETRIGSIHIVIPDLQSQRLIVGHLDRETAEIDATIADAKQAVALSKERRAALISAAVTGKIDVRDAVAAKRQMLEGELVVH